jgi:VanZ family protein
MARVTMARTGLSGSAGGHARGRSRLLLTLFWLYALAVFTATHWPKLKVPGPEGTDKIIHMGAFGTWTVLFACCAFMGPRLSPRNVGLSGVVALAYAGFDELTQHLSAGRTVSLADFGANATGVLIGATLMVVAAWLLSPQEWSRQERFQ